MLEAIIWSAKWEKFLSIGLHRSFGSLWLLMIKCQLLWFVV